MARHQAWCVPPGVAQSCRPWRARASECADGERVSPTETDLPTGSVLFEAAYPPALTTRLQARDPLEGRCSWRELIHPLVARVECGEGTTASKILLRKEEQPPDLPPVGEEFRYGAAGFVAEVPQEARIGWAMPGVGRGGGHEEAGPVKGIAPVDLQSPHDSGERWATGEGGNPAMLLDRENGRHGSLGAGDVPPPDVVVSG